MLTPLQSWSLLHMLLAATVAGTASWALRRRVVAQEARPAAFALRLFWAGLGTTAFVQAGMLLLAAVGTRPPIALAGVILAYGSSVVALGALAAYFVYLLTGRRGSVPLVAAFYIGILGLSTWGFVRAGPATLSLTRWGFVEVFAHPPTGIVAAAPAVAALVPAIGGAVAFLVLGFRSTGATRQRGVLVGFALALWFGLTLIQQVGAADNDLAHAAQRLASLCGFTAIYLAYLPPRILQERWGLSPLLGHPAASRSAGPAATARARALEERLRQLV